MEVIHYRRLNGTIDTLVGHTHHKVDHVVIPLVASDDTQYSILLIDADDSFDIAIQEPDNTREIIWSLCKDPQEYQTEED